MAVGGKGESNRGRYRHIMPTLQGGAEYDRGRVKGGHLRKIMGLFSKIGGK